MGVCWPHSLERCPPTYGASPEVFKWQVGMHRWEGLSDWGWGLTWDMPGCSGLYSVLVSMCSGTRLRSLRTWRASLWSSAPRSRWSFFPSSVTKRIRMVPAVQILPLCIPSSFLSPPLLSLSSLTKLFEGVGGPIHHHFCSGNPLGFFHIHS